MEPIANLRIEEVWNDPQTCDRVIEAAKESEILRVNETHPVVLTLCDTGGDDDA